MRLVRRRRNAAAPPAQTLHLSGLRSRSKFLQMPFAHGHSNAGSSSQDLSWL